MARPKFHMTIPGCSSCGCPFYVNNCKEETYVKWAKGRTLYWGERYCLHGKRARQFWKSVGTLPSWCPRRIRYPVIRIYTRRVQTYFEERFGIGVYLPNPKDYHLCRITNTMSTPLQFSNKVRNRNTDLYELLGWHPKPYDVIEIDVGLRQFHIWLSDDGWYQVGFASADADQGIFGDFQLIPHQDLDPHRYSGATDDLCLGHVNGYFAGGVFRSQWISGSKDVVPADCQKELESLLLVLQTEGFLKSLEDMDSYCWRHWWAGLDDGVEPDSGRQYGFYIAREHYYYYLRLAPSEDSAWNIRVFVYGVYRA